MEMVIVKLLTWFTLITAEYLDLKVVFPFQVSMSANGRTTPVLQGIVIVKAEERADWGLGSWHAEASALPSCLSLTEGGFGISTRLL